MATALITGSAQRIGRDLALHLAKQGYNIALHYNRSRAAAEKLAAQIRRSKKRCEAFGCDLKNEAETLSLIKNVKKNFSDLQLLVNNASTFKPSKLSTKHLPNLYADMQTNAYAPYILSCEFKRLCRKGQIINILDTHVTDSLTHYSTYLLSKKFLAELTKISAVEFAPNIRVNAIAPGLILPPKGKDENYLDRLSGRIPMKRKGTINDIRSALEFLITNAYITGQTLFIDGGEHLL